MQNSFTTQTELFISTSTLDHHPHMPPLFGKGLSKDFEPAFRQMSNASLTGQAVSSGVTTIDTYHRLE